MKKNFFFLSDLFSVDHFYIDHDDQEIKLDEINSMTTIPLRKLLNTKLSQMELEKEPTVFILLENLYRPPEDTSLLARCTQNAFLTSHTVLIDKDSVSVEVQYKF